MKKCLFLLFLICCLFTGCTTSTEDTSSEEGITFTDALSRNVTISDPQRVGIASGSFADCWLLAGGEIAAVTRDAVEERDLDLPENYVDLGSLKEPSVEAILNADLDFLILMPSLSNHVEMAETLDKTNITYAYFEMETFDDYLEVMDLFTDITGRKDLYDANAKAIEPQIETALANADIPEEPRVLVLRTSASNIKAMNSDTMVGSMLKNFGCANIADSNTNILDEMNLEAIVEEDPEYIFFTCMGDWTEGKALIEAELMSNPIWEELQAVRNNRVFYLEKELFHHKPNVRWGESYEILADHLSKYQ